ncbi:ABC transporter permease [Mesorhizobium amorphae]|uniref:ABC transporter permease n=1 Tax=Mesorhizobium amorphae TaxID=71433 RepID=UPI001786BB67|nr:ABC transporter permease [Mesorhizobium amorphae]
MIRFRPASTVGARLAFLTVCALVLLFLVLPVVAIVPLSFSADPWFTYPLPGWSLRWYQDLFGSEQWRNAFFNSLIVGSASTVLATLLGTLAAFGLAFHRVPFRSLVMAIVICPMIVPVVITAVAMYFSMQAVGLANSYTGIILAHTALSCPFVVLTVMAVLNRFDRNLERAAASLGAGPITVFRKVTFPIIAPGIVSGALFAFFTSWDEVIVVLFLGAPDQRTLPRQMFSGIREQLSPTIIAAATLLIAGYIILGIFMAFRRDTGVQR